MSLKPPAPFNSIMGIAWLAVLVFALIYVSNNVTLVSKYTAKRPVA